MGQPFCRKMQTWNLWRPFATRWPATSGRVFGEPPGRPVPCQLQTRWYCQPGLVEGFGPPVAAALVGPYIPPPKRRSCCCSRRSCFFAASAQAAWSRGPEGAGPLRRPAAYIKLGQIQAKSINLFLYRKSFFLAVVVRESAKLGAAPDAKAHFQRV